MGKLLQLQGKVFGSLTVVRFLRIDRRRSVWECRCVCGTVCEVRGDKMRSGTRTCGCLRGHTNPRGHGLTHERLYNVYRAMKREAGAHALAKCWQGTEGLVRFARWYYDNKPQGRGSILLIRYDERGAFCPSNCALVFRRVVSPSKQRLQLLGRTFGLLTVIASAGVSLTGKRATLWLCECRCGQRREVLGSSLVNGTVRKCSASCQMDTRKTLLASKGITL